MQGMFIVEMQPTFGEAKGKKNNMNDE